VTPVRAAIIVSAAACTSLAALAIAACSSTAPTVGVTPITGIIIRSDALVAGLGCGTASGQVYRYVATVASNDDVVNGVPTKYINASVFECYADGVFQTIPLPASGNPAFTVGIAAFNKAAYDAQRATLDVISAAAIDPTQAVPAAAIGQLSPTWTTTCHATQQANVAVLAVCNALAASASPPSDAGADAADAAGEASTRIQLGSASFPRDGGAPLRCGTDYTTLRGFFDQFPNDTGDITCPAPLVIAPAKPNVTYHIDVVLTKGLGAVAQAKGCTAVTTPGATTVPTCPAFQ